MIAKLLGLGRGRLGYNPAAETLSLMRLV
jgi:hypothetical protein